MNMKRPARNQRTPPKPNLPGETLTVRQLQTTVDAPLRKALGEDPTWAEAADKRDWLYALVWNHLRIRKYMRHRGLDLPGLVAEMTEDDDACTTST